MCVSMSHFYSYHFQPLQPQALTQVREGSGLRVWGGHRDWPAFNFLKRSSETVEGTTFHKIIFSDCIAFWSTEAAADGKIAFFTMIWKFLSLCIIGECEIKQFPLTVVDLTFIVNVFLLVISVGATEEIFRLHIRLCIWLVSHDIKKKQLERYTLSN